jgi:photosystem II stability/assembly factor-like uncharacterized protein
LNARLSCIFLFVVLSALHPFYLIAQTQWDPVGPFGGTVRILVSDKNGWFYTAIQDLGFFRMSPAQRTWVAINKGLRDQEVTACNVAPDGRLFCGGANMLAMSPDHGDHWSFFQNLPTTNIISNILVLPDSQLVISYSNNCEFGYSPDYGSTWRRINISGVSKVTGVVTKLEDGFDHTMLAAISGQGIYRVYLRTGVLQPINYDLPHDGGNQPTYNDCSGFATLSDGSILLPYRWNQLFRLDAQTEHWQSLQTSLSIDHLIVESDSLLYAYLFLSYNGKIGVSTDRGQTWSVLSSAPQVNGMKFFTKTKAAFISSKGRGLWRSDDNVQNWSAANYGIQHTDVNCVLVTPSKTIIVGTADNWIMRSQDGGVTWSDMLDIPGLFTVPNAVSLKQNSKQMQFAASDDRAHCLWRSTMEGGYWSETAINDSGFTRGLYFRITDLNITSRDEIFVSGYSTRADSLGGMFKSVDDGVTWKRVFAAPGNSAPRSFLRLGDSVVAMGTSDGCFYRSVDLGATWTACGQGPVHPDEISMIIQDSASILLAASSGSGVIRSTNMGVSWSQSNTGLFNLVVHTIAKLPNGMVFAGTESGGYISVNHGLSWTDVTSGMPFRSIRSTFVDSSGMLYTATEFGVYKTVALTVTSSRPEERPSMPEDFALFPNYPNPFNPSTWLRYRIPARGQVVLNVYDVLGREMAVLVSGQLEAGTYTVKFDGARFSSGIYFARLSWKGQSHMIKLFLMK